MDLKWMGVGAAVAALTAMWGHVQGAMRYMSSIFVITRTALVRDEIIWELFKLLKENAWVPRLGVRQYRIDSYMDYNRKASLVVAENMYVNKTFLAFYKYIPIIVKVTDSSFSITYVRGTFNILKLYSLLRGTVEEELYRTFEGGEKDAKPPMRYFLSHVWGSLDSGDSHQIDPPLRSEPRGGNLRMGEDSTFFLTPRHVQAGGINLLEKGIEHDIDMEVEPSDWVEHLYLEETHKELLADIDFWLNSKDWYVSKKIPWKRGILLAGAPGTGKSSLVFALARKFDIPIKVFHLNSMTTHDLNTDWQGFVGGVIHLIEDIDGVFDGRRNIHESKHRPFLTFDGLLNTLDGVDQNQGVLTIITTNHAETLDPALGGGGDGVSNMSVRPGRVDRILYFDKLQEEGRRFLTENILGKMSDDAWSAYMSEHVPEPATGAIVVEKATREALCRHWAKVK